MFWHSQIDILLNIHCLNNVVEENQSIPPAKKSDGSKNPKYREWQKCSLRKTDKVSMQEYLIKVQVLVNGLKAINEAVKDSENINYVADGLGPDFRSIIYLVRPQRCLKFDKFYHLLNREDLSLKRQNTTLSLQSMIASSTFYSRSLKFYPNRG